MTWTNVGDFTSGKGWKTATNRNIKFSGTVSASGNFYLAVYTWSGKGENYVCLIPPCSIADVTFTCIEYSNFELEEVYGANVSTDS